MDDPRPDPGPEPDELRRRPHGLSVRHLMFLVLVAACAQSVLVDHWRPFVFFAATVLPIGAIVSAIVWFLRRRSAQQEAFLAVLAIAAERRVPLSTGADAFAGLCSGGFRRRAQILARILEAGQPLPRALEHIPGLLSGRAAALAGLGWNQGALASGLREAQAAELSGRIYQAGFVPKLAYLTGIFVGFQVVTGFMLYWIVPKFEAVCRDFGVDLPAATVLAVDAGRLLLFSGVLPLILVVEALGLLYLVLRSLGIVTSRLPGTDRLCHRVDVAAALRGLAVTVDAARPLAEGLRFLAEYHPVGRIRRRLARAAGAVERGEPWTAALVAAGLIRAEDAALLEAAQRAGNLGWALRTLAEGYERRHGYRLQLIAQILTPVVVVLAGAVVGLTVVGYFMPILTLTQRMGS